jgi:hypothetical protein
MGSKNHLITILILLLEYFTIAEETLFYRAAEK